MTEIVLSKNAAEKRWQVTYDGAGPYLISSTLDIEAGDVVAKIQANNPGAKIGIIAIDLGPAVAFECARLGYGEILWMKS